MFGKTTGPDNKNALRAYLQRAEVRLSTMHRIAGAFLGGAGLLLLMPTFLREELAFREEGVKVTIALSKKSVEFFKSEASKHHTQYQRMIRKLIDSYVDSYAKPRTHRSTRTASKRAAG